MEHDPFPALAPTITALFLRRLFLVPLVRFLLHEFVVLLSGCGRVGELIGLCLAVRSQAAESHQPILISGKRSSAVLVSAEDWQAIQETLYLLSVPGMRESIKKGRDEPLAKSTKALDW